MKNILSSAIAAFFLLFSFGMQAQNDGPAPSPANKTMQKIGTTQFTLEYSRPSVKDREIFGALVPYDKVWRTGANSATKISFDKDITVEGKPLAAGDYAIFTTPGKESWQIHFHKYGEASPNFYNDKTPLLTVTAKSYGMGEVKIESFIIMFDSLRDTSGELGIGWDNVYVPVALGVK